jgi:uncharacterized NAD(P)/FAD-binding protein YdhS
MPNPIVIIGGGFSGTVLAANLLRRPPSNFTEIVLIERGPEMGRGVAYAVHERPHLLNVPAGRLSAEPKDPSQFLRFARRTLPDADAEDFLSRQLYGDYLQDFLSQAEREAPAHVRLSRVFGEVTHLSRRASESLAVHFSQREPLAAQRVILAVGNPPPPTLPCADSLRGHPAYLDDPWAPLPRLSSEHCVLIIGNGLTMADVVSSFSRDASRTPRLLTISRRGLVPLPQSTFRATAVQGDGGGLLACSGSIRQVLAASRALARDVAHLGGDWREVVTFIRNVAPGIWQRLPEVERRRFLRHLQCYWDIHRHRLPPELAARLDRLRRSGKLEINAGRIDELRPDGDRLRVRWRRRGSAHANTVMVDAVVNATGPDYALKRSRDPLLKSLRSEGWVSEDELDLGLRTTSNGACVAVDGHAGEQLFYLGPMLRAGHWEATAATELRNHAEQLAQYLVNGAGRLP